MTATPNPLNTVTPNRLQLDAGALWADYGEAGEGRIGATRGGAVFTVEREDREVEIDGAYHGPFKELVRNVREVPKLEFTLLEVSLAQLVRMLRGSEVSDGTHNTITPSRTIASGDYLTNIALVATVNGTSTPCVIVIKNALERDNWTFTTSDQDEGRLAVTIYGHYSLSAATIPPYEILWPVGAS